MIVQIKPNNIQYIYTNDASKDYLQIATELGLAENNSLKSYVTALPHTIIGKGGVKIPCIKLDGYSNSSYYIMNDHIPIEIKQTDYLDDKLFTATLNAFNAFENANVMIGGKIYTGPFKFANGAAHNTIEDRSGKCIMLSSTQVRDVNAINTLLSRLNYDNGSMYMPVVKRYIGLLHGMRDKKNMPIGYFNCEEYFRVIKSKAKDLFNSFTHSKSKPTILLRSDGKNGMLSVDSCKNGVLLLKLSSNIDVVDVNSSNAYNPFVIVSLKPFKIANTKFPWQWVKDKDSNTWVCMTPIICPEHKLNVLKYSINLLET